MDTKRISLVLDDIRIAMYGSFIFIIILGYFITRFATDILFEEPTLLSWWYGQSNVCLLFDFPPAAYVLPIFWSITVVLWMLMTALLWFRQSEAALAGQIPKGWYWYLNYLRIQESVCVIYFTSIFAVRPDEVAMIAGDSSTFIIHSVPFLFMILALSSLAISDAIYDVATGFASIKGFRQDTKVHWAWYLLMAYPVILFPLSVVKMSLLVNAISHPPHPIVPWRFVPELWNATEYGNTTMPQYPCITNDWPADRTCGGKAWCSNCPDFATTAMVLDRIWTVTVILPPLLKAIISSIWLRHKIFRLTITIVPHFVETSIVTGEDETSYSEL